MKRLAVQAIAVHRMLKGYVRSLTLSETNSNVSLWEHFPSLLFLNIQLEIKGKPHQEQVYPLEDPVSRAVTVYISYQCQWSPEQIEKPKLLCYPLRSCWLRRVLCSLP